MAQPNMSKQGFLVAWQHAHGQLDGHWEDQFLERPELEEIIQYPRHAIQSCISYSPKLTIILQVLRRRWVINDARIASRARSDERVARKTTSKVGDESKLRARQSGEPRSDLAAEGKILPLPDNPMRSKGRGSPGYKTGIEAELRNIAQKHRWF